MRYIKFLFLAVVGAALLIIAIANRGPVTLQLLPAELAGFAGVNYSISLPLFVVILAGVTVGLLIGFVLEWLREHKHRSAASRHRRERDKLEKEVVELREPEEGSADEVLAIIDRPKIAS